MGRMLYGPVIVTRYLGPTNHRGSRVVATHRRDQETTWRVVVDWDYSKESWENHQAAALALVDGSPMSDWGGCLAARGHDSDAYYFLVGPSE